MSKNRRKPAGLTSIVEGVGRRPEETRRQEKAGWLEVGTIYTSHGPREQTLKNNVFYSAV